MNDPVVVTALALLTAALAAWAWARRRSLRRWVEGIPRLPASTLQEEPEASSPSWPRFERILFALSLVVYAATRLIGIEQFPIYFFTDEAANAVLASDFLHNGLRDAAGQLFPAYFANSEKLSLSLSVYLQVLPALFFGTSVFVTRAVSALVSLSGAAAIGLILRDAFRVRAAWIGVMLLAITPAWFLHSRTAFETTLYASMFAWFLYFYLRYRAGRIRAVFPAVLFAALAFYAYNAGQPGLVGCSALLVLIDARYHWENRRAVLLAAALALVLAIPYLRFQADNPGENVRRLQLLDSYLVRPDLTAVEKANRFVAEFGASVSPAYWYGPNSGDLVRHQMKGYGHLLWPTLPLAAIGAAIGFRRWRHPRHRAVLIAALSAPAGAAMAGAQVTRMLVLVVPATLLTVLGAEWLWQQIGARESRNRAVAAFVLLSTVSAAMVWDALTHGPTWYRDYGLTGMQFGASQVFSATSAYLTEHPESQAWIFPTAWNGSDMLRRFFAPGEERISLLSLDSFLERRFDSLDEALVVLAERDYARVVESGKVSVVAVEGVVPLPDGRPGYYLARLVYSPEADAIFAGEDEARRKMEAGEIRLADRVVTVRHTPFDQGSLDNLFDGDRGTWARTSGVNPAVIELDFGEPIRLIGLGLTTGHSDVGVVVRVDPGGGVAPGRYEHVFTALPPDPTIDLILEPPPGPVRRLTIEIRVQNATASSHVHLREIRLIE